MDHAIPSEAFRRAAMRSERHRIVVVLVALGAFAAVTVARAVLRPEPNESLRLPAALAFLACASGYELLMLVVVRRAERGAGRLGAWVWALNTVVECSVPTLALLLLTIDRSYFGPYRALAAPTVLLYCILISLATLRLSPALCVLAGAVSALGYVAVFLATLHSFPDAPGRRAMPPQVFVVYPVMLLCAGMVAAGVARQIRRHVIAALLEAQTRAETRVQLDRVEYGLKVARSIQMGLLPRRAPSLPGYDVAGWSQPAEQTGGDYYDWTELRGGRVMFTVADAAGHGIGPALLVAACRAYFRAVAARDDPLERVAAQVDALVAGDAVDGRFITAAIALLDPARHQLSLYSAGHAPTYLYVASTDEVTTFDADQPPLGAGAGGADDDSPARVLSLAPGDALVLLTDGFFESPDSRGEQLGIRRLGESIRRHHSLPADALIRRLHEEVLEFSRGVPQSDDLTAVVIKRAP
jgi:serine phosphatase RsbU (regulator of sigma subunit)